MPARGFVVVTGHRKIGANYLTQAEWQRLQQFAKREISKHNPYHVIIGMALGWDMACAKACVSLEVPFTAAVPFVGQEERWPVMQQIKYRDVLRHAAEVVTLYGRPSHAMAYYEYAKMMTTRNHWMVDKLTKMEGDWPGNMVLALWNGQPKGGTYECIKYAESRGVPVRNIWDEWESFV